MTTLEQPAERLGQPPSLITMQQPETAKNIHVYLNGDKYFAGRKFVVNRRYISNFDGFLNQITLGMKAPFGAIRNVYTPQGGHRVNDLQQLETGMHVVAGGVERFRKLEYNAIASKKRPQPRRNYLDIKLRNNRINVSARWRKYIKDPCQIYVYGNGDMNAPALRLLLIPRCMKTWDLVLSEITEKLSLRTGTAVRKLFDMNFKLLLDPSQLESGQYYVAVGNERLKRYPYGEIHKSHFPSPRRSNLQPLPPIKSTTKSKSSLDEDGQPSYTKMKKQIREQEEETTVMGASAATGYRPLKAKMYQPHKPPGGPPTQEADSVFHAKPVKVKRASGRGLVAGHDPHPPLEESDGVFRTASGHFKAEEVAEDEHTKVDLPIDQVAATEIEEENIVSARSDSHGVEEDLSPRQTSPTTKDDIVEPSTLQSTEEEPVEEVPIDDDSIPDARGNTNPSHEEASPEETLEETKPELSDSRLSTEDHVEKPNTAASQDELKEQEDRSLPKTPGDEDASSIQEVVVAEDISNLHDLSPTNLENVEAVEETAASVGQGDEKEDAVASRLSNEEDSPATVDEHSVPVEKDSFEEQDASAEIPSEEEKTSSSPVGPLVEDETLLTSEEVLKDTSSSKESIDGEVSQDVGMNLNPSTDPELSEKDSFTALNDLDHNSSSNDAPALPNEANKEQNEESLPEDTSTEEEPPEEDANLSLEETETPAEKNDSPSSPKPDQGAADSPSLENTAEGRKDTNPPASDDQPQEEVVNPSEHIEQEEEETRARPASDALTADDDHEIPTSPSTKHETANGSATAVHETA